MTWTWNEIQSDRIKCICLLCSLLTTECNAKMCSSRSFAVQCSFWDFLPWNFKWWNKKMRVEGKKWSFFDLREKGMENYYDIRLNIWNWFSVMIMTFSSTVKSIEIYNNDSLHFKRLISNANNGKKLSMHKSKYILCVGRRSENSGSTVCCSETSVTHSTRTKRKMEEREFSCSHLV